MTLMGTLLAFAVDRGIRKDNPAHGVKSRPFEKWSGFCQKKNCPAGDGAGRGSQDEWKSVPAAAIKLLLLTGCRRSEILGLQWQHVDFERQCLRLPDSKTGAKVVYLNAPALSSSRIATR